MSEYGWGIGVGILVIVASLGRALAGLLRAHATRIIGEQSRVDDPRVSEVLDDVLRRLSEQEERLDFAERLLATPRGKRA